MLWNTSGLNGYSIKASDGEIGSVGDFLFSDADWRIRWLVADTGNWLPGRQVLLHPSLFGEPDAQLRQFPVALTKAQIEASPHISTDQPVSRQMEEHLHDYYGWNPAWGESFALSGAMTGALSEPVVEPVGATAATPGDPHLRSAAEVTGYHLHASDGDIGHVSDFLVGDEGWTIGYLRVETSNWWLGETVLISPRSIRKIDWSERMATVDLTRSEVKASKPYRRSETVDGAYDDMSLLTTNMNWIAPL